MGNTGSGSLWYYAICATRCTYNMHGISRFNGIFYPGRRRNYQTSSIPSRLAPMRLLFERKKKTMPSPYEIWILSNNSMALWIWYKKFCFQNIRLYIERVIWEKGFSYFIIFIIGSPVRRHKLFSHQRSLNNIYRAKKKKKNSFFLSLFDQIKKQLWDCWMTDKAQTKKYNKYIKQRSHHSIFEFFRKEGW